MNDRVGLGWRPEIAAGIFSRLDRIDVVEVIADDYFDAPSREIRALRTLGAHVPVVLHGVSLGLASTVPVDARRLEKMARLVDRVRPEAWSEHLAFVRGGGVEIGHLAAPPRTESTVDGAAANLDRARAVVGSAPLVENIATLIDPPGSDLDEGEWIRVILAATRGDLLLDLHNLHANAVNFGFDAREFIRRLPADRIGAVHLAGGKWIGRLLDDHLHDVPDEVYDLLERTAAHASRSLTVILERDGNFPPMDELIAQLDRARVALRAGRRSRELARV
ncbi:MAG TPA: DUF692 domain-containing protein [Planctomycetota bacterium]|nr:DUF692 domain-containing protein [Planctomycetota bacterium]